MKSFLNTILMALFFYSVSFGQANSPHTDEEISFRNFMGGVRYAHIVDSEYRKYYRSVKDDDHALVIKGVENFLKKYGFEAVTVGGKEDAPDTYPSLCELTIVTPQWDKENGLIVNLHLSFSSCQGDIIQVPCRKKIPMSKTMEISGDVERSLFRTLGYSKTEFHNSNSLKITQPSTGFSESNLREKFLQEGTENIEGIYECMKPSSTDHKYQIGIVSTEIGYQIIYLNGAKNHRDWNHGEIKGQLTPTASNTIYKSSWKTDSKEEDISDYVNFKDGLMSFVNTPEQPWIKIFPTSHDMKSEPHSGMLTGTGFAVSSDGLIATAYHVIENRKQIIVRGIDGDLNKRYNATVIATDKKNDLAILQIENIHFEELSENPLQISHSTTDLGSDVFVLSYPLTGSMGEDIKLTTGIINAKSGFQGDQTNYQISAAVHPGSSGGPVFSANGALVGIVNSRYQGAESVTYALKSQYLATLLQNSGYSSSNTESKLNTNLTLSAQARKMLPFVFIIESH
ncbi:MAG: trypsin-like peptidase domain-containing protein [Flavobacteriales bacterium]|nr:trypsin-like peptidase domain-containing protein [Flavobacteriales bacterium]